MSPPPYVYKTVLAPSVTLPPYYNTGDVFFYDGFEDWVRRGGRNDNSPNNTGSTIITSEVAHTGQNSLLLKCPSSGFQDYNLTFNIANTGSDVTQPLIVGMEAHVMIRSGTSSLLGFSIERTGFNNDETTKREWRCEVVNNDVVREVTGTNGSINTTLGNMHFQRTDQGTTGQSLERSIWYPMKLTADLNNVGAGAFSFRVGQRVFIATQADRATYSTGTIPADLVRFEFHCSVSTATYYIDDMFLTKELSI